MAKLIKGGTGTDSEFAGARLRGLNLKPLRRTLASKDVSDSAKNALKRAFTDGIVTAQKLSKIGYAIDPVCPLCKEAQDSVFHRAWECPSGLAESTNRKKSAKPHWRRARILGPIPGGSTHTRSTPEQGSPRQWRTKFRTGPNSAQRMGQSTTTDRAWEVTQRTHARHGQRCKRTTMAKRSKRYGGLLTNTWSKVPTRPSMWDLSTRSSKPSQGVSSSPTVPPSAKPGVRG